MSIKFFFRHARQRRLGFGLAVLTWAVAGQAQIASLDPDWQETEVPAPPGFSSTDLLNLDMPKYVTLNFGIDPSSIAITPDGIVRYVVVVHNASGAMSAALYEGIRCATSQVKTYARSNRPGSWISNKSPEWRDFTDNLPSKHAWVFARQAACDNRTTTASSVSDIIRAMKK